MVLVLTAVRSIRHFLSYRMFIFNSDVVVGFLGGMVAWLGGAAGSFRLLACPLLWRFASTLSPFAQLIFLNLSFEYWYQKHQT